MIIPMKLFFNLNCYGYSYFLSGIQPNNFKYNEQQHN